MSSDKEENYDSFRKSKSFSKCTLTSISLHSTGQELGDNEVKWLSLKVTEEIKKLLNEAGKYARRTRDDRVRLPHIQHAGRTLCPDLLSRLVLRGKVLEEPEKAMPKLECSQSIPKFRPIQLRVDSIFDPEIPLAVQNPGNIPIPPNMSLDSDWMRRRRASWMRQERAQLMRFKNFPLTKEQLEFYQMVTESCVGKSESKRVIALHALSTDPTVEVLLPRLCVFIGDAVTVNVCDQNILFLFFLMRMIKALLSNSRLHLHRYLHLLLPAVLTCLLTSQVFYSIGMADHWSLREYAGSITTEMVRQYEAYDSGILPRVIGVYKQALLKKPLTTMYGAVIGLGKMGNDAVRSCILPKLIYLSRRIEPHLSVSKAFSSVSMSTLASKFISHRLMKMCNPLLNSSPHDKPEVYSASFGLLGPMLRSATILSRIKAEAEMIAKVQAGRLP